MTTRKPETGLLAIKKRFEAQRRGHNPDEIVQVENNLERFIKNVHFVFLPRLMEAAWMPRRDTGRTEFTREYGNISITLYGTSKVGIPSGHIPRKILMALITKARRDRAPLIDVSSIPKLLEEVGLSVTSKQVQRVHNQLYRLSKCSISIDGGKGALEYNGRIFRSLRVMTQQQLSLFASEEEKTIGNFVEFDKDFFESIISNDIFGYRMELLERAGSALEHDIMLWIMKRATTIIDREGISFRALREQFANNPRQKMADFKKQFLPALEKVSGITGVKVEIEKKNVIIHEVEKKKKLEMLRYQQPLPLNIES
jgi:hypothetical protein